MTDAELRSRLEAIVADFTAEDANRIIAEHQRRSEKEGHPWPGIMWEASRVLPDPSNTSQAVCVRIGVAAHYYVVNR